MLFRVQSIGVYNSIKIFDISAETWQSTKSCVTMLELYKVFTIILISISISATTIDLAAISAGSPRPSWHFIKKSLFQFNIKLSNCLLISQYSFKSFSFLVMIRMHRFTGGEAHHSSFSNFNESSTASVGAFIVIIQKGKPGFSA